jgi:hypothetical protein
MSYFITHKPCPRCGSSDAYAEYDDGHHWCFSCRKWHPPNIQSAAQVENALFRQVKRRKGELPQDLSTEIPKEPYSWLKSYSLTTEEITNNNIGWSQQEQMLVFPFLGEDGDVLLWQGRYFPARSPKVYTSGYPDDCILLHNCVDGIYPRRVVVVEDSVSAIKVARVCDSSELLGSNISKSKAVRLSRLYEHLTIWLDNDKITSMLKFVETYGILFKTIDYVYTELDPKQYNTEQIKELLKCPTNQS